MLFFLTGDIQTGKTRWLQALCSKLEQHGIGVCGVIAPGVWVEHVAEDGTVSYEKMGIENVLLPEGVRVAFARRRDLALEEGAFDPQSQAARSQLGWAIDDGAIAIVNEHLSSLLAAENVGMDADDGADEGAEEGAGGEAGGNAGEEAAECAGEGAGGEAGGNAGERTGEKASEGVGENVGTLQNRNLLVIDELGRLELCAGEGLVAAIALVDRGATEEMPHALVVVREQLFDIARERFADAAWCGMCAIAPDAAGERSVLDAFFSVAPH